MSAADSNLLELAPAEIAVPLKVSHGGHAYRVCHRLRPPAAADWLAYEAALQLAVEELPPETESGEPGYRFLMRASEAALDLWGRLIRRVDGYALPDSEKAARSAATGLEGHGFSERSGDPGPVEGSPAERNAARSATTGLAGQGFSPDMKNAARSAAADLEWHGFSRAETDAARSATSEGAWGNPPSGFPDHSGTEWRDLIPFAHKEAAVRALTLVAPAAAATPGANGFFPLRADEVPVVLEAALGGRAYPRLVHRFRPPSVDDERAYRRLLAENLVVRGARHPRTLIPARLPALVRLYDRLILDVEGYAINNQPPASRNQLLECMDAWHKRVAVETLFGGLAAETPAAAPREESIQ